jgi:hypothetical protein
MIGVNQAKVVSVMSAYVTGVPIAPAAWEGHNADAPWDLAKSTQPGFMPQWLRADRVFGASTPFHPSSQRRVSPSGRLNHFDC